jgi:ankyrin repeat protein
LIISKNKQAATRGGKAVVEELLKKGANPSLKNKDGNRAQHLAKDNALRELLEPVPDSNYQLDSEDEENEGDVDSD